MSSTDDPGVSNRRPPSLRQTWHRLNRSVGAQSARLGWSVAAFVAAAAMQGLALACLVPVFSAVFTTGDPAVAGSWLAVMAGLSLVAIALRWWGQGFDYDGHVSRATHALRHRLGEHLRRMPLERLQQRRSGEINAMLLGNADENLAYALTILNLMITALVAPIAAALALMLVDWRLGLLLMAVLPPIIPLYRMMRPLYGESRRVLAHAHEKLNAQIVEYVQGLPVLRSALAEGTNAASMKAEFAAVESLQRNEHRRGSRPTVMIVSVVELALLGLVAVGGALAADGDLDIPVLAAVTVIVTRFAEPLSTFVTYTAVLDVIEAALERMETLLSVQPLPQMTPSASPSNFNIQFENVTFRYAGSAEPALLNYDMTVGQGKFVALVGASGAGKTTVARLLQRHADPQSGRILIGGVDLRGLAPDTLSQCISVVFQDVYLFDDTVTANIRLGRADATDADVLAAAQAAHCVDFITRLPQGFETRLGGMGARLSGGERQRISIARAILKDAPIVLLDEPTSSLDADSDLAVQKAIETLVKDRLVITIAHRLSSIVKADEIIVLDDGAVVQRGRHHELLGEKGKYRSMWEAQISNTHPSVDTPLLRAR